jgi:hypothetical protein
MKTDGPRTHSGKYSCAVASSVRFFGINGSAVIRIVVTPALFILAIVVRAISCPWAGSNT